MTLAYRLRQTNIKSKPQQGKVLSDTSFQTASLQASQASGQRGGGTHQPCQYPLEAGGGRGQGRVPHCTIGGSTAAVSSQPQVTAASARNTYPAFACGSDGMSYAHANANAGGNPSEEQRASLSPSPEPLDDEASATKHRRNYQACDGCRMRKVKCDLGPVDAPHPPPCARCRRENKICNFAETRKKRKSPTPTGERSNEGHSDKRPRTISNSQTSSPAIQSGNADLVNPWSPDQASPVFPMQSRPAATPPLGMAPRLSNRAQPAMRPEPPRSVSQLTSMPGPPKRDVQGELMSQAAESLINDPIATSERSLVLLAETANSMHQQDRVAMHAQVQRKNKSAAPSIRHVNRDGSELSPDQIAGYRQALKVWNSMAFVRSGFFSAEEGIAYVDYFFDKLQPMTPVVLPDYRDVSRHLELWTSEPILALAILTVASRYKELTGAAATSRQYSIHDHLWRALTNKVQRLLWGQEQFGGGKLGRTRELANGQLTWVGSLRTLGTIEALLLLTDWQPRSLHFPPGNDEISLLAENFSGRGDNSDVMNNHEPEIEGHDGGPHSSWLEPAWRSDRMSWDLLSLAQALSCELGAFDDPRVRHDRHDPDLSRKNRIRRMLTVYAAQTSGRIGIPSILRFDEGVRDRWQDLDNRRTERIDLMQSLWVHIAHIMDEANREIFPSREYTINLTRGTEYRDRIQKFTPLLYDWMQHFNRDRDALDEVMSSILLMEFEYARLYINSIGLQHVVESWVQPGSSASNMVRSVSENKQYIDQFTEAALHILEIVSGKMNVLGVLRDAPVRTFLRTLSAMMFTLKRLSMGNHEKMVRKSIDLLEQVTKLLTTQVVDDVHLSGSTARMIEGILMKVKETMIRVQKRPNTSGQPSREHSRAPSPQPATNGDDQQQRFMNPNQAYTNGMPPFSTGYSDPLASIEARPMADLMDRTFIPPPGFNFQTNDFDAAYMDDTGIDHSVHSEQQADWLTLPLDGLNSKDHFRVDQGYHGIGPSVGQQDMLEVLTQAPFDQHTMQWLNQDHLYSHFE